MLMKIVGALFCYMWLSYSALADDVFLKFRVGCLLRSRHCPTDEESQWCRGQHDQVSHVNLRLVTAYDAHLARGFPVASMSWLATIMGSPVDQIPTSGL